MGKIVLVLVAAAWAAVLLPPLLRGRSESRPASSVVDFRRQLSTLQRSTPMRGTSMRSMARPLAPAPTRQRPYDPAYDSYESSGAMARPSRRDYAGEPGRDGSRGYGRDHSRDHSRPGARPVTVRQRRQNVLMILVMVASGSAFIAFTTKSDLFVYVFVLSAMSLAGYCYKLSQMRRYGRGPQAYRRDWIRAA